MNKQNKIIVGVVALILALTVGYAIFSQSLNINGTAKASANFGLIFEKSTNKPICRGYSGGDDCQIDDVVEIIESGKTLKITIDNLMYPTAYVKIPVLIKNIGTVDAVLKSMQVEGLESNDINVKYSITEQDIKDGYVVKPGDDNRKEVEVEVTWDKDSKNSEPIEVNFTITMNFEQASNVAVTTSNSSSDSFPILAGKLGDNVTYTYDNGSIVIDGTGEMSSGETDSTPLRELLATNAANELGKNDLMKSMMKESLSELILSSITFDDYLSKNGVTKEVLKNQLTTSTADGGNGFTDDDAEYMINKLELMPKFKNISIVDGITSIRENLLEKISTDSVVIPDSVVSIESGVFIAVQIDTIKLGSGLKKLVGGTFSGEINNIILNDGLLSIEKNAMKNCHGITSIVIPSSVTTIDNDSISGQYLTTIVNKTGKAFDWNGILTGTSSDSFETGNVNNATYGTTITITK